MLTREHQALRDFLLDVYAKGERRFSTCWTNYGISPTTEEELLTNLFVADGLAAPDEGLPPDWHRHLAITLLKIGEREFLARGEAAYEHFTEVAAKFLSDAVRDTYECYARESCGTGEDWESVSQDFSLAGLSNP